MAQLTEYQSKTLLARFGLPVGAGTLAADPKAAAEAATRHGLPVAVKAQVPVSGRGKAGAILRADTAEDAGAAFERVTSVRFGDMQAAEALVEPFASVAAEHYLAVAVDASAAAPQLLFSAEGGIEVEGGADVATIPLREDGSVRGRNLRAVAYAVGVDRRVTEGLVAIADSLARALRALDAVVVEVNPLAITHDGRPLALDARVIVDDNALFRQPELRQIVQSTRPRRRDDVFRDATRLEYVQLDGSLGIISGGAGMTMAVMDMIADHGGSPACFLDCSANPTRDGYGAALDLLLGEPGVDAILVSVFGGLTQMERAARTLADVVASREVTKPITFRLMGTNIDQAESLLLEAGIENHRTLEAAVEAAVRSQPSRTREEQR